VEIDVGVGMDVGDGGMERDEIYKGKEEEPVLALLPDL